MRLWRASNQYTTRSSLRMKREANPGARLRFAASSHNRTDTNGVPSQLFTQIESSGQLCDQLMALWDCGDGERCAEPPREPVCAHRRASGRKQFEHAAAPKEIEIIRIDVLRIAVPLSRIAGSSPAVFQSHNALAVELGSQFRSCARANNSLMQND